MNSKESLTQRESCHLETHGIVLEDDQVEQSKTEPAPHEDVGNNSCSQAVCVDHGSSIPEQSNVTPRQRSRDNRDMNETRGLRMSEVEKSLIDEVRYQDQFTLPEETSYPAHDEAEVCQIVEDEVGTDIGSRGDPFDVGREQVIDVSTLKEKEDDPVNAGD